MLPIEIADLARVATLPFHHRDPFDRLLAAQGARCVARRPLRLSAVQTKEGRRYLVEGAAAVGGVLCTTDCVPKGIRSLDETHDRGELGSIRDPRNEPTVPESDAKCLIVHEAVTAGDSSHDAVATALALALERAAVAGEWTLVATLAAELAARRAAPQS